MKFLKTVLAATALVFSTSVNAASVFVHDGAYLTAYDATTGVAGLSLLSSFDYNSGGSIAVSSVPVPSAIWLFGSGLIGLVGFARRKAQALNR